MCSNCGTGVSAASRVWLVAFPGLRDITDLVWREAVQSAQERVFPPKTVIVRKNDPCVNFLLVAQGTVRVYQSTDSGREHVLYRASAGDICVLTLQNLLAGTTYSAEAATEDEVRVVSICANHFYQALSRSEAFRNLILSVLARRLGDMMQLVEQVTFQGLDLRLVCLLGQMFGRHNASRITITHQELAEELGTSREVISRLLKEFERLGCIRLHRCQIELLSPSVLAHLTKNPPGWPGSV